jgi:hypothetical protein
MIQDFRTFSEEAEKQSKEKLKILLEILKKNKFLVIEDFTNEERPYIYVKIDKKDDLYERFKDLDLGIRIFSIGKKLVYRIQQGTKGHPVGTSKSIEKPGEIEDHVAQGKSEIKAYKDVFSETPKILIDFMDKVLNHMETKIDGKPQTEFDIEQKRMILNSIISSI